MISHKRLGLIAVLFGSALLAACSGSTRDRTQRFLNSGDDYFSRGKFREAAIEYSNAVQIDGLSAPARLGLAKSREKLGDFPRALAEYVRVADLLPTDRDQQLAAGRYLLHAQRFDEAKARAEAVLALDSKNVEAQVLLGYSLAGLRNIDQAISEIEEAVNIDPLRGATYTNLGFLQAAGGHAEAAERAFKRAVELEPEWVPGHLALASHYWSRGKNVDAERSLSDALGLEPGNPVSNRAIAMFFIATDRADRAEPFIKSLAASGAAPFALADFYLLRNRPADAIPHLQKMRNAEPTAKAASRRLAQAYAMAGDISQAHHVVDELLAKNSNDPGNLLLKGQLLAREGKRDEAFAQLQAASQLDPNSAAIQYALGRSHTSRGDVDRAREAYLTVLRLNPRAASAQVELSRLELAGGRVSASVQHARDAVKNEPNNLAAQLLLVRSLLVSKDVAGARAALKPLLDANPNEAILYVHRGYASAAANDLTAARRAFVRALELDPKLIEAIGGMVAADLAIRDFPAARARIEAAVKTQPDRFDVRLIAARTYATTKDFLAAERELRRALEIEPNLLPAYTMLGQLFLSQGRLAEAQKEFETLSVRQAKPVAALTMLGIIAQVNRDETKALEYFQRALELDSRAATAANNLAWIYAERGEKLDYALQLAHTAVQELPRVPEVLDTLGWVHYKRKTAEPAVKAFREAVSLAADNPTYHYHLGLAQSLAEDPGSARLSLERALAMSDRRAPWATAALEQLSAIESASK